VVVYAQGRIALWSKSGTIRKLEDFAAVPPTSTELPITALHAPRTPNRANRKARREVRSLE